MLSQDRLSVRVPQEHLPDCAVSNKAGGTADHHSVVTHGGGSCPGMETPCVSDALTVLLPPHHLLKPTPKRSGFDPARCLQTNRAVEESGRSPPSRNIRLLSTHKQQQQPIIEVQVVQTTKQTLRMALGAKITQPFPNVSASRRDTQTTDVRNNRGDEGVGGC